VEYIALIPTNRFSFFLGDWSAIHVLFLSPATASTLGCDCAVDHQA
jgi:hypothetical protein